MKPLVSVIIPTYNRATLVLEAIHSATRQLEKRVEIIVVDDGSTDDTREKVWSNRPTITYLYQPNKGLSAARNLGLKSASGDFVIFLDSDDEITPDKVRVMLPVLQADPVVLAAYSRWRTINETGAVLREPGVNHCHNILPTLLCRPAAVIHAFMFSTSAVRDIGGFDENLSACEDWDLQLRMALEGHRFGFCSRVTAIYRLHDGNMSENSRLMLANAHITVDKAFASKRLPVRYAGCKDVVKCIAMLVTIRRAFLSGRRADARALLLSLTASSSVQQGTLIASLMHEFAVREGLPSSNPLPEMTCRQVDLLKEFIEEYVRSL